MSANFSIRGIPAETMLRLKQEAKEKKVSVNSLILNLLAERMGLTQRKRRIVHHDLDHLAGTWSLKEYENFEKNIEIFGRIVGEQ